MMKVHTYLIITCMFLLVPWSNAPMSFQEDKPQYSLQQPIRIRPDYVEFNWQQGANDIIDSVQVIGEWDWDIPLELSFDESTNTWTGTIDLDEGLYCYKFVLYHTSQSEPDYRFDEKNAYRGYCEGFENSVIRVENHLEPKLSLEIEDGLPKRVLFHAGSGGAMMDSHNTSHGSVFSWSEATQSFEINHSNLNVGKHSLKIQVADVDGYVSDELLIPFWLGEGQNFQWEDALVYMIMTDRFVNGNSENDPLPLSDAAHGADWMGGDFEGVTQMIESGYFNSLGVNALWLTPFNQAADGTGMAADNQHKVSAYHGYWPVEPRKVDSRLGTEEELQSLVQSAHEHGIRVMMDLVVNHVHEDHPYVDEHPDWFNSGCICGTDQCDWTERRLDCLFRDYMPDVNWKHRNASEQMIEDALWWLETFDLDGARVDAVKHVDDLAVTNLAMRINEKFEIAGTDYYLKGETAMGWSGDDLAANAEQYGTINRYIGENALDGQADFVLYHAVVDRVFIHQEKDYHHLDYWTARSQDQYVQPSIMVPYVGSHDVPRFISRADTGTSDAYNQWLDQGLPGQPGQVGPYEAALQAYTWLLTTPGAPLLYQGDEYGEYGGADPDNRHMWRDQNQWNENERNLWDSISEIGKIRLESEALRRGEYISLYQDTDAIVWGMETSNSSAMVVMNRGQSEITFDIDLSSLSGQWDGDWNLLFGACEKDGQSLTIPAKSVAIFSDKTLVDNDTNSNSTDNQVGPVQETNQSQNQSNQANETNTENNQSEPQIHDNQTQINQSDSNVSDEIEIDTSGDSSIVAMVRNVLVIAVITGLVFLLRPRKDGMT